MSKLPRADTRVTVTDAKLWHRPEPRTTDTDSLIAGKVAVRIHETGATVYGDTHEAAIAEANRCLELHRRRQGMQLTDEHVRKQERCRKRGMAALERYRR